MAHRSHKNIEQPSTPSKTPYARSKYPLSTPITPPSPILSVSQLQSPPWNGGSIPIKFDSDDSDASDGINNASRYSRGTFGSMRLSIPTSDSDFSLGSHRRLSFSDPSMATPKHTPPRETVDNPEANRRQNGTDVCQTPRATKTSHASSQKEKKLSHAGFSNPSNFTPSEYYLQTSNSADIGNKDDDQNPFLVGLKKGDSSLLTIFEAKPAASGRPATAPSFSPHSNTFSIKRKPPPTSNFDMVTEMRGNETGVGVIGPFLEHPFRMTADAASHLPPRKPLPTTLPNPAPILSPSSLNIGSPTPVLKPKTNIIISTPKLRPNTSAGERRKALPPLMPQNIGVSPSPPKVSQAHREDHRSQNHIARSTQLPTPNSSAMSRTLPTKGFSSALEGLVLRIHVDQERFREVSPTFVFHGFKEAALKKGDVIADRRAERGEKDGAAYAASSAGPSNVLVEYKMHRTESFCFHYSVSSALCCLGHANAISSLQPLDSSPTVRKLTVDGDDKHDYLSREAALILKTNGLYSVKASELKGTAMWQFTYSVEDRKNFAGDKIPGEKVMVSDPFGIPVSDSLPSS